MDARLAKAETELVEALHSWPNQTGASPNTVAAARSVVLDSVAVGIGTRDHPAAAIAREHARNCLPGNEAAIWGSGLVSRQGAILANTVPLRCYDFNDVMRGTTGQGGHPSDNVPGLLVLAAYLDRSGAQAVEAIVRAYDATRILFDLVNITALGWDYTNLTGLGAVAGYSHLLALDADAWTHAFGIYASSHLATNQMESGDLSRSGNLTMWKRFNGAEASLAALQACLLAASGVEAPTNSLLGQDGFFSQMSLEPEHVADALPQVLAGGRRGVEITEFKSWPVGTRAQSAIEAAMRCREQLEEGASIDAVTVEAEESVVKHLVRPEAWKPYSRETADHSLPYAVAVALLEGDVGIEHYEDADFIQSSEIANILAKIDVRPVSDPPLGGRSAFPTRITVETSVGPITAAADYHWESIRAAAFQERLEHKFSRLAGRYLTPEDVAAARDHIARLDQLESTKALERALAPATTNS